MFSVPFVPRLLCCEYVVGVTRILDPKEQAAWHAAKARTRWSSPETEAKAVTALFDLGSWASGVERIQDPYLSISCHFYLILSISIHFLSISFQFLFIRIHFYPFLSIAYSCLWSKISQVRRTLWYAAHNHAMQKPNNILNHFDPFLECRPTHRGLFEVGQNEMEACFLEPPCQPAISAIAICQRKKTLQALKNNLPLQ